ncbi:cadherin repeat domain-containing protein [Caulobacter soli]|uniref:cadherin repeat domain-containing protein n=1 Tax=Caulobacter soli TaxID=2708539 RepID=UPI0013EC188F|nr:cadherin repeat domain-containing protein [Caulobacter soli]
MGYSPGREGAPYLAIEGADFGHDWIFQHADGSPRSLAQVVAVDVRLEGPRANPVVLEFALGDGLAILSGNVVRMAIDRVRAAAWPRGPYTGGMIVRWADGTDTAVVLFTLLADTISRAAATVPGASTSTVQCLSTQTRVVMEPAGVLSSIVPQIQISALEYPDNTPVGTVVAFVTVNPPGAEIIYSLADDAGGALTVIDSYKIAVAGQPDALVHPALTVTVEGAVTDGPTRLSTDFTFTLQPSPRGRLRFNDPANSGLAGAL